MKRLKVMTILGTRPEIIRLSRVINRLDEQVEHIIVHTGQNYDYELNEVFFENLDIRKPDQFLGCGGGTLGETLGKILIETEKAMEAVRPDAVLILGDTNSAIAAIIARRRHIPVYHMEAGNRCYDRNVPEETNRRIVDHIADFNLVYTEHARRQLLSEGLPHRRIYLTGSPMYEVLKHYEQQIMGSSIVEMLDVAKGEYIMVSLHREENVDNPETLCNIIDALRDLYRHYGFPILVSTHPRTRKRLEDQGIRADDAIRFHKPFGFFDYNNLQKHAFCVVSDSGTIAEESSILGFPAVTPRFSIERPEALDTGAILVSGTSREGIMECVCLAVANASAVRTDSSEILPDDYQIANTSERVVNLLVGTARLSNAWDGIRTHNA